MKIALLVLFLVVMGCCKPTAQQQPPPPPSPLNMSGASALVTWTCLSAEDGLCPWGDRTANQAVAWPSAAFPFAWRLGYQASQPVYLDAFWARGCEITITDGHASVLSGMLDQRTQFSALAALEAGQVYRVPDDQPDGTVVSLEGTGDAFSFSVRKTAAR